MTEARSGKLALRMHCRESGARLVGATVDGMQVLSKGELLWSLELRDTRGRRVVLNSDMGRVLIGEQGNVLQMRWQGFPVQENTALEVRVDITFEPDQQRLLWAIEFVRIPQDWTVFRYVFPNLNLPVESGSSCAFIEPRDWGTLTIDPLRNLETAPRVYSRASLNMQFFALQRARKLVYLGCHDLRARSKEFLVTSDRSAGELTFGVLQPTRMRYGAVYRQEYPFVIQVTEGDWYDASQIYRAWALTAPWTWRGPLHEGRKTPRRYIETPLVLMRLGQESCDPAFAASWAVRMQEWFGVPIMFHWYNWHQNFGSSSIDAYPEYFPARAGFRRAALAMRESRVQTMPYLNARLWRTDFASWHELGRRAAVRDPYGEIHREVWMKIPGATMNPASRLWRWVIGQAALRCVDAGCSGVYLDQLAESSALPSYDPEHPHEPGETAAWIQGYWSLCEEIRREARAIDPDFVLTAEGNAEPYMAGIDAFLTGNLNAPNSIPLFSAVYHDYVMQFGRYVMASDLDLPRAVLAKFGQQFIYGGQFGWSRACLETFLREDNTQAVCLRKMARLKAANPDLLGTGRMLRPLDLARQVPLLDVQWYQWSKLVTVSLPQVQNSVWQDASGQIGILLLNIGDTDLPLSITLPRTTYPPHSPDDAQLLSMTDGEPSGRALKRNGERWQFTVPALSPLLLTMPGTPPEYPKAPLEPEFDMLGKHTKNEVIRAALPFFRPGTMPSEASSDGFPFAYEGDVLPQHAAPRWHLVGIASAPSSECLRVENGKLVIDTLSAAGRGALLLKLPRGPVWDVDGQTGFTVASALRVLKCNKDPRFAFWLQTNTEHGLMTLQIYPDRIVAPGRPPVQADMATHFRTIRIVGLGGGKSCDLYLDGERILEKVAFLGGVPRQSQLAFGAGASSGRVSAEIDWIRFHPSAPLVPVTAD
ncbi:MAG: hypothetical protein KAI66_19420 [Lentisphaeria bacterium]|nr:hypothetical protein [Lentisphaeria bacterium]